MSFLRCPFCGNKKTKVVDKRLKSNGLVNRRRRLCLSCSKRFTTFEKLASIPLMVVKRDGRLEAFDREKILKGVLKACEKRSIDLEIVNNLVSRVESLIISKGVSEIGSVEIGSIVLEELEKLDEVAYLRFASVYKDFNDAKSFQDELVKLKRIGGGLNVE